VDVDQADELGVDAGLLAHLADGRSARRLARLDVAAGQAPPARQRAFATLDQQHHIPAQDGGAGRASRPRPSWLRPVVGRSAVMRHAAAT